jgi:hypothetical protein
MAPGAGFPVADAPAYRLVPNSLGPRRDFRIAVGLREDREEGEAGEEVVGLKAYVTCDRRGAILAP